MLEPARHHYSHCPWVDTHETANWRGVLDTLRVKYEATRRSLKDIKWKTVS